MFDAAPNDSVPNVIGLGASAGGTAAIKALLRQLPRDLSAVVAMVIHRSPNTQVDWAKMLGRGAEIRVLEPYDGDLPQPGCAYRAGQSTHGFTERTDLPRGWREASPRKASGRPVFRIGGESVWLVCVNGPNSFVWFASTISWRNKVVCQHARRLAARPRAGPVGG